MDKNVWIPEAPKHPGLYALPEARYDSDGKLGLKRTYGTHAAYEAVQHETREECQAWCDAFHAAHPEVAGGHAWEPREHGFVS